MTIQVSRRNFLKSTGAAAGALVIGLNSKGLLSTAEAASSNTEFNPFVWIDTDGMVTVAVKHFEMGQGTTTGLTTLIAEELDADWAKVKPYLAHGDSAKYKNLFFGAQGTGGSTAMANSFMQYRQAGATARDLLVRAAAAKWNVASESITIENGVLKSGSHSGHFGEFAADAAKLTPAENVAVKTPDQFKLIGKVDLPRKDSHDKTNGTATFAIDVKVPGMVYAVIQRSPRFGGTLVSFDASEAKSVTGFIDAKAMPNKTGVVVYAKNTWAALKARDAISAEWDFSAAENRSTDQMAEDASKMMDAPSFQVSKEVTLEQAGEKLAAADKTIEAEFSFPMLAHAPMEPLNCVIEPTENGGVRFHDGCQFPGAVQPTIAHVLQLKPEQVEVNTVYAGGSFGRRATPTSDYQVEAALAFLLLGKTTPVKLVYSREDDIKGGYYRSLSAHRAAIGLDQDGNIAGWDHRIVTKPIMKGTAFESFTVHDGVDHSSVEGAADSLYNIPNQYMGLSDLETATPVLWWRSVGHTHTAYAMESLLDMVAHESGKNPMDLRLGLLNDNDPKQSRLAGVLKEVWKMSDWDNQEGRHLGLASHFSFNTYVAIVADVTVDGTDVHVNKLHVAVDCGVAVNPDVIKAQMEGGCGYGLGAIYRNEVTLTDGEVDQENFPDYEPLRMSDMPEIEVSIIQSAEAPTGVGEPALPPVGAAVANAFFKATGTRITQLPMTKAGFDFV